MSAGHTSAEMEQALAAARAAAEREGIAHGGPMGEYVAAQEAVFRAFDTRLGEVAADMRRVAEADIERTRAGRENAEAAARKAEAAAKGLKYEVERLQTAFVEKLSDEVAREVGAAVVVVEKARAKWSLFRLSCAAGAAALALFGGGYGLKAWQDRDARAFHAACAREAVTDGRGGIFCPLGVLAETGRRS